MLKMHKIEGRKSTKTPKERSGEYSVIHNLNKPILKFYRWGSGGRLIGYPADNII